MLFWVEIRKAGGLNMVAEQKNLIYPEPNFRISEIFIKMHKTRKTDYGDLE